MSNLVKKPACLLLIILMGAPALGKKTVHPGADRLHAVTDVPVRIRVRLLKKASAIGIKGLGLKLFKEKRRKSKRSWKEFKSSRGISNWSVSCAGARMVLRSDETKKPVSVRESVVFRSKTGILRLNGRLLREEVRVFARPQGCEVVNVLHVDKYLEGVVSAEFSPKWHPESVAAQVVAARTYAVYRVREARRIRGSRFDIEGSILDQVYQGFSKQDFKTSQIIDRTRGVILGKLSNKKYLPIKAFYHSTCGGRTELPQNVWGQRHPTFKKTVSCPYCHPSPNFRWNLKLSSRDLKKAVLSKLKPPVSQKIPQWSSDWKTFVRKAELVGIRSSQGNSFGRSHAIALKWKSGTQTRELWVSSNDFRNWVGNARFKSTTFNVTSKRNLFKKIEFQFEGKGFGHGVGLCQWGAKTMAEKGFVWRGILSHYYPHAKTRKIW